MTEMKHQQSLDLIRSCGGDKLYVFERELLLSVSPTFLFSLSYYGWLLHTCAISNGAGRLDSERALVRPNAVLFWASRQHNWWVPCVT